MVSASVWLPQTVVAFSLPVVVTDARNLLYPPRIATSRIPARKNEAGRKVGLIFLSRTEKICYIWDMRLKGYFLPLALALTVVAASCNTQNPKPSSSRPVVPPYGVYYEGLLGSIEPAGWLREYLERQNSGLTGHPDALAYPYNTCLWAGQIERNGSYGQGWWRYEQTAYYTDGLLRLGYALGDSALVAKGETGVNYTLDHVTPEGVLGVHDEYMLSDAKLSQWPHAVFFRAMQAMYQATGDERIPAALEKHYLNFPVSIFRSRNAVNVEGILWTYSLTGNPALLELAEAVWKQGDLYLNQERCLSDEKLDQHGVTVCEMMKIPVILYEYTGKKEYLDAALNADFKLESVNLLPDGVPSSAEYLCGQDPTHSHETCDIADYSWTMGYYLLATGDPRWADRIEKAVLNAGTGCVTKDFKALQYFSSVNQFIATGRSNNNVFKKGRAWMAFRPTHETECCSGNVHRIMPNYVARMWLRGASDEIVAALYGPSKVSCSLEDGTICTIEEITEWPFGDRVKFRFSFEKDGKKIHHHTLKFTYRIPEGCTLCGESGPKFVSVEREFRNSETLRLDFGSEILVKESEGGVYFQRGPLVFALPVKAKVEADTTTYSYMNGKFPDEPGFACLDMTPESSWKWAVEDNPAPRFRRVVSGSYPWDKSPVSISVSASEIEGWDLEDGRYTCAAPSEPVAVSAPRKITLVPYGCTTLRLTVFPKKSRSAN